jgi:hypothetical protein
MKRLDSDERLRLLLLRLSSGRAKRGKSADSLNKRVRDAEYLIKEVLNDDLLTLANHAVSKNDPPPVVLETTESQLKFFTELNLRDWQVCITPVTNGNLL